MCFYSDKQLAKNNVYVHDTVLLQKLMATKPVHEPPSTMVPKYSSWRFTKTPLRWRKRLRSSKATGLAVWGSKFSALVGPPIQWVAGLYHWS